MANNISPHSIPSTLSIPSENYNFYSSNNNNSKPSNLSSCKKPNDAKELAVRHNRQTEVYKVGDTVYKYITDKHLPYLNQYQLFYNNNPTLQTHLLKITEPEQCSETHIAYSMPYLQPETYVSLKEIRTSITPDTPTFLSILAFLIELNFKGGIHTDINNLENIIVNREDMSEFYIIDYDYFQFNPEKQPLFPYDAIVFYNKMTNKFYTEIDGSEFALNDSRYLNINANKKVRKSYNNVFKKSGEGMVSVPSFQNSLLKTWKFNNTNKNSLPVTPETVSIIFFAKGLHHLEKQMSHPLFEQLLMIAHDNGYTFWTETENAIRHLLAKN